jgi:hypothetical protein
VTAPQYLQMASMDPPGSLGAPADGPPLRRHSDHTVINITNSV